MLKEIEAGAALENCRRLINQINAWLSAEERRQSFFFILGVPRLLWKSPHHAPPIITNDAAPASLVLFGPGCEC